MKHQNTPSSRSFPVPSVVANLHEGICVLSLILPQHQNPDCRTLQFSDTLQRHVRKQHKITEPLNRARRACVSCHAGKSRCEGGVPCEECVRRNIQCSFQDHASVAEEPYPSSLAPPSSSLDHAKSQLYYWEKRKQYVHHYFEVFHPCWPFIHKGSFNVRQETPLLLHSVVAIGMWTMGERSAQSAAMELHGKLDFAIRDQRVHHITDLQCTCLADA